MLVKRLTKESRQKSDSRIARRAGFLETVSGLGPEGVFSLGVILAPGKESLVLESSWAMWYHYP